jgi:CBS domain-containing protein
MVLGSEGRQEQTLATDQDNAIVYEDLQPEEEQSAKSYFIKLGEKINHTLHAVGYNYCKGEVMAMNSRWTQSLRTWKTYFTDWIHTGTPHDVLEASIFFDFRFVFGEEFLVRELRDHVHRESDHQSVFFYHMAQAVLNYRSPLNIFGKIVGNASGGDTLNLDIKKSLLPVIAFIRLYAIREKIAETNSSARAEQLYDRNIIGHTIYEEVLQAYRYMTQMRIRAQVKSIIENDPPGNLIDLNQLSRLDITLLKTILTGISELQTQVRFDFKGTE